MATSNIRLRRFASCVVTYRRATLALVFGATCALAIGVLNLHVEINPDEQLPQGHPYVASFRQVHRLFGDKDLLVIALSPKSGNVMDPAFLRTVRDITLRISELPGCVRPLLQGLGSPATKTIRLDKDGLRVEPLLAELPETPRDSEDLRSRMLSDRALRDTLISRDGRSVAIYANFEPSDELPGYVNVIQRVETLLQEADTTLFSYNLSGPVAIVAGLTTYAGRALVLFPLAILVIAAIHLEAFRTWQAVVLPLVTGLLGVVWALGLMGLLGIPLDPFNSTTPVLILAIGTGHAVQILSRYYEQSELSKDARSAIIETLANTGSAMIAASLIAALSFLSLATLGTASMRRFGFFTAFGIISILVIEMTLIPALRASSSARGPMQAGSSQALSSLLRSGLHILGRWVSNPRTARLILIGYGVLICACAALSFRLSTDSSFVRQFRSEDAIRRQDTFINENFSGANVLIFIVSAPSDTTLTTPSALNAIDRFERAVERLPDIGKVLSLNDILRQMHQVLMPDSTTELPDTTELIAQYLFLYSLSGGDDLYTKLTPDNRQMKIVSLATEDSTAKGADTIQRIHSIADEMLPSGFSIEIAGTIASNLALTEAMVRGKLLNICQIIGITGVVSAIALRSILGGLLVAMPLTVAVLVNFGAMSLTNTPLDVATSAVSAMAVGIGADYAVYFLFRLREEIRRPAGYETALRRTMDTAGASILFVALAIACGYGVLCFSGYQLYVDLGLLIALAMVTASIASITAIPSAITILTASGTWPRLLGLGDLASLESFDADTGGSRRQRLH